MLLLTSSIEQSSLPDWILYLAAIAIVAITFSYVKNAVLMRPQQRTTKPSTEPIMPARPTKVYNSIEELPGMTLAELSKFDGHDTATPLYLGCGGLVFDVSSARGFYGPGAPYGVFAGKDGSRGLARMEIQYTNASIDDLTGEQQVTLDEWTAKYKSKYDIIARIVDDSEPHSGNVKPKAPRSSKSSKAADENVTTDAPSTTSN